MSSRVDTYNQPLIILGDINNNRNKVNSWTLSLVETPR